MIKIDQNVGQIKYRPLTDSEAVMIYEHGSEPDISAPKEIVGTTIFTAAMVFLILAVL